VIKNLFINNFKSLNMIDYIDLNYCSFLCGANSSGKSSLIQTLLMLAQTFSARANEDAVLLNGELIRLGAFNDIKKHNSSTDEITIGFEFDVGGSFYIRSPNITSIRCELIIGKREKSVAKIDEEYHPLIVSAKFEVKKDIDGKHSEIDYVHYKLTSNYRETKELKYELINFDTNEDNELLKRYPNHVINGLVRTGDLIPTLIDINFDETKRLSQEIIGILIEGHDRIYIHDEYYFQEIDADEILIPSTFSHKVYDLILEERRKLLSEIAMPEYALEAFRDEELLKNKYFNHEGSTKEFSTKAKAILEEFKDNFINFNYSLRAEDLPNDFLISDVNLESWFYWLNSLDEKKSKNLFSLLEKHKDTLQNVWYDNVDKVIGSEYFHSPVLRDIQSAMTHCFSGSIKYLGPLRNEPQAVYSSSPYDANTVGLKGEFTASLLHRIKSNYIEYASPEVVNGKLFYEMKDDTVNNACKKWLSFLGVVEEVRTSDKGKLGYELYVKTAAGDKWQDLTHVGVGVSQVLPIILMFLHSDSSDILIFEQPELHLHPKVQSKLCDLFLVMAETGRQCIIETHSEYMINRLRLRVVQDQHNGHLNRSSLYFIGKFNGNSSFRKVEVNKYGAISDWPDEFFDQTDKEVEKILMEASKKRNGIVIQGNDYDSSY